MTLEATLDVEPSDAGVEFTLHVQNTGEEPVDVRFRSGKRIDVTVERAETGEEVWRWSEGRMFTQALSTRTLESGDTVAYEVTWDDPPSGEYRAVASLAAEPGATAEATVSVA